MGHSRYFASHIKKKCELFPCIAFWARQMIRSWGATEGHWCCMRFGAIYSLFSSSLAVANYCRICAGSDRDCQHLEMLQVPVSVGASLMGGTLPNPPWFDLAFAAATVPSPSSITQTTRYGHNFQDAWDWITTQKD